MVAVDAGLLMFGGVAGGDVPFAPECWLLQLGPSPLLGLKENEVSCITRQLMMGHAGCFASNCWHLCMMHCMPMVVPVACFLSCAL